MFTLSPSAIEYIKAHGSNVMVTLKFSAAIGGWACSNTGLRGSFHPHVFLGKGQEASTFLKEEHDGITIWYDYKLELEEGADTIDIDLLSFLIFKRLSVSGAKTINVVSETGTTEL